MSGEAHKINVKKTSFILTYVKVMLFASAAVLFVGTIRSSYLANKEIKRLSDRLDSMIRRADNLVVATPSVNIMADTSIRLRPSSQRPTALPANRNDDDFKITVTEFSLQFVAGTGASFYSGSNTERISLPVKGYPVKILNALELTPADQYQLHSIGGKYYVVGYVQNLEGDTIAKLNGLTISTKPGVTLFQSSDYIEIADNNRNLAFGLYRFSNDKYVYQGYVVNPVQAHVHGLTLNKYIEATQEELQAVKKEVGLSGINVDSNPPLNPFKIKL